MKESDGSELADAIISGLGMLADAITPRNAAGQADSSGGFVESLTEAVMGLTSAAGEIAGEIHELVDAVRDFAAVCEVSDAALQKETRDR